MDFKGFKAKMRAKSSLSRWGSETVGGQVGREQGEQDERRIACDCVWFCNRSGTCW